MCEPNTHPVSTCPSASALRFHDHARLQKHALYEEPAFVYLGVTLGQLRISDANALLLPDQKSSRSKKHRQYNMPAQDPSLGRLQHGMADGAMLADQQASILPFKCERTCQTNGLWARTCQTCCGTKLQGAEGAAQPTFEPRDDAASDATIAPDAESDDE